MESEGMQFDDTDLIFESTINESTIQVPPQKPLESLTDFIQKTLQKASIPKEELRKKWINIKSDRDKKMKQWRHTKEQLAYYLSKTKELEYDLNRSAEELERNPVCSQDSFITMSSMESEGMQFDDTDLIFESTINESTIQVPPQKPLESLTDFIQKTLQKASIPKEELRKKWINIKSDRDKKMKQWRHTKEQLAYYLSKTKELEYDLNRSAEELERLRAGMLADCLE